MSCPKIIKFLLFTKEKLLNLLVLLQKGALWGIGTAKRVDYV